MVLSVGMCAPTCTLPPYRVFLVAARQEGRIGIGSNSSRRRSTTTSWRDRQWDWEGAVALACAVVAAAAAALADAGYAAAGASSSSSTGSTTGGSRGCHSKRGQGQERFFSGYWLVCVVIYGIVLIKAALTRNPTYARDSAMKGASIVCAKENIVSVQKNV